jgi:hypothetical protein
MTSWVGYMLATDERNAASKIPTHTFSGFGDLLRIVLKHGVTSILVAFFGASSTLAQIAKGGDIGG